MTEAEIYDRLTAIFRDVFVRDDLTLTPQLSANGLAGWDSFKQIDIIVAVQGHFRIKFRTRDLDRLDNVGDFVRLISAELERRPRCD